MFNPADYGEEIAGILALDGNGERLMPLSGGTCSALKARGRLQSSDLPVLVRAGLFLYFGCWEEAHSLVDDLETPDGCYWHAIVHRQEPDAGNSGYWFGRVGAHPVFPALRARAVELGLPSPPQWDPFAFIHYCERAAAGSGEERRAMEVQRAEWQLLFDHCAG
jgi:hypothetical protein